MNLLNKKIDPQTPFSKNEKVVNLVELPDVPAGTQGKVKLANGISWRRYWVYFENEKTVGQIDEALLARPQHQELMQEKLVALAKSQQETRVMLKKRQEELLDLLLNPPPEKTEEVYDKINDETGGEASGETSGETGKGLSEAPESSPAIKSAPESAPESANETETPLFTGTALVDVPEHLVQRSHEARVRLE